MINTQLTDSDPASDWKEVIRKQVSSLNYGSIEIVVHESKIVEIDTTQRFRFPHGGLPKFRIPEVLTEPE
jgi:hypothetical protein